MPLLEPPRARPALGVTASLAVALLLFWNPLSLALVAAAAWSRLARFGVPAWTLLAVRVALTVTGILAARLLLDREVAGRRLAAATFTVGALVAIVVATTPYFPSNAVPSTKWLWVGVEVAIDLGLAVAVLVTRPHPPRDTVTPPS